MAENIGRTAVVHYRGTLEDGSEFDSSIGGDPLEFVVGAGDIIPGFDRAVAAMNPGDKTTVTIPPDDAYGERTEEAVQKAPREMFGDHEPVEGEMVGLVGPDGRQLAATIGTVAADGVELDFNHPLAGKTLTFEIELLELIDTEEIDVVETPDGIVFEEVDVVETKEGKTIVDTVDVIEED